MDGLPHFAHGGFFYNGLPFEGLVDGVDTLGIHNAKDGIVTRGVLVDMAWFSPTTSPRRSPPTPRRAR